MDLHKEQVTGKIALGKMEQTQRNMENMPEYRINTRQEEIGRKN